MNALTFIRLLAVGVAWMATFNLQAQKIRVVDKEGRGIPYAMVLNTKGNLIGTTNLLGILADVMGWNEVLVSHIAYKPQQVVISSLSDGIITMENTSYSLPKPVETPKSHLYIETYYRVYVFMNGLLLDVETGIKPIDYDINNNLKIKDCSAYGKNLIQIIKRLKGYKNFFNSFFSPILLAFPMLLENDNELTAYNLTIKDVGNEQKAVNNKIRSIGKITRSGTQSRWSIDMIMVINSICRALGEKNFIQLMSGESLELQYTAVSDNEKGKTTDIDDLKMFSNNFIVTDRGDKIYYIIETYVTERNYKDPEEIKEKEKQFKAPMSFDKLEAYAADHNIPALAPILRHPVKIKRTKIYL